MMRGHMDRLVVWAIIAATTSHVLTASAFDKRAHTEMTVRASAAAVSRLDAVLRVAFREFSGGIASELDHRPIFQRIADGSVKEDDPVLRVRSHFHDPTRTWNLAGLDAPAFSGESAILWQQDPDQGPGGRYIHGTTREMHISRRSGWERKWNVMRLSSPCSRRSVILRT
jgi:hypothetical protein